MLFKSSMSFNAVIILFKKAYHSKPYSFNIPENSKYLLNYLITL
jgi:hypothetical protein